MRTDRDRIRFHERVGYRIFGVALLAGVVGWLLITFWSSVWQLSPLIVGATGYLVYAQSLRAPVTVDLLNRVIMVRMADRFFCVQVPIDHVKSIERVKNGTLRLGVWPSVQGRRTEASWVCLPPLPRRRIGDLAELLGVPIVEVGMFASPGASARPDPDGRLSG